MTLDAKNTSASLLDYDYDHLNQIIYGISSPKSAHYNAKQHISVPHKTTVNGQFAISVWAAYYFFSINVAEEDGSSMETAFMDTESCFCMDNHGGTVHCTALPGLLMLPHMNLGMGKANLNTMASEPIMNRYARYLWITWSTGKTVCGRGCYKNIILPIRG